MSNASQVLQELFSGVFAMGDWTIWVMLAIGAILIWLGVRKGYEPVLLFPMGVGCILANIPGHFAVMPTGAVNRASLPYCTTWASPTNCSRC